MSKDDLDFNVDQDGPIPVYVQIENQIQFGIASGAISAEDALPSVRDLSAKLHVNPNTVTKSYRDLELLGILKTRRGIGVKVSVGARSVCKKRVQDMVKQHLRDAVGESMAAGLTAAQIRKTVSSAIASGYAPYSSGDRP